MSKNIEIIMEVLMHATEDKEKIFKSINQLFGLKEQDFVEEKLVGHFSNPISLLRAKLTNSRALNLIEIIFSKISKVQKDEFFSNITMHLEGNSLFLRLGKQEMTKNIITLKQNDSIKIKISMAAYKKNDLSKNYLELLDSNNLRVKTNTSN